MVKHNASISNLHYRILRICKVCLLIDNFRYTFCTCRTHGNHDKYHGEHHKAHQNIHTICKKAHQLTCCQTATDNHLCTQPADSKNTCINSKLHNRHIHNNQLLSSYKHFINLITGLLKFSCLIVLTNIGLYHAHCIDILLYTGIKIIILFKYFLEIFGCLAHNKHKKASQENDCDQINAGDSGIDHKCHCHSTDQTSRSTSTHTQNHLVCILQIGHISSQTSDQTGCAEFVNIGK